MLEYTFRVYIHENSVEGMHIIHLLQDACKEELVGKCKIEIVDIKKSPERLEQDNIFVFPTIVKISPPPLCELVGNIENKQDLLKAIKL
ncbi:MAG: hypothetical protein EU536_01725 [Promethearchaeota archaeon]|nr:MAG: hypothetical protein EU536_01725 [Candidatus Lokiarchaeota archaeon]